MQLTDAPRYVALSFDAEAVDSDDSLDVLLARLADTIDLRAGREELVVWDDAETIVAVLKADGSIHRTHGPGTHQPAQDGRPGDGQAKRRR